MAPWLCKVIVRYAFDFMMCWKLLFLVIYWDPDKRFSVVCRGFSGTYVKEYIEASSPAFAIGEYWDSLGYEHGSLCYNQGNLLLLLI